MCIGSSAYSASVKLSLASRSLHVGEKMHLSVTVSNDTKKVIVISYPRVPRDSGAWAARYVKTASLIKDGKTRVGGLPASRYTKEPLYQAAAKKLRPAEKSTFTVDLRRIFYLPVPETGKYKLAMLGAELDFQIKPVSKAIRGAYLATDPKWHRCLEYVVVPAGLKKDEWLLLGRRRNDPFYAGTYLSFKPTFMRCARVKMPHTDRSINGILLLLGAEDRLYYIDPRFTHYDQRVEADVHKMHYKQNIASTAVPGVSAVEKVVIFPNEFTEHMDYQITVRTAKKKTIFLRQIRSKMEVIDKAKFNQGQKNLEQRRIEAERRRKEEEKEEAEKQRIERERKLAEATPTPAELRAAERKALDKERAYKQKQISERAAGLLMKEAESARKKGQLVMALVRYMKVVEEYPETTHAKKAGELVKRIKTEIVLRNKETRTRARLSMATLKRALERIGRDDGMAVEMIMKRLRTQATDPEGLKNAQKLLVKAVPLALKKIRDKDAQVRMSAAIILGEVGPDAAKAVPALAKALKDKDIWVRVAAAIALGKIGPTAKAAIPSLKEASKDGEARVRKAVAKALEEIEKR